MVFVCVEHVPEQMVCRRVLERGEGCHCEVELSARRGWLGWIGVEPMLRAELQQSPTDNTFKLWRMFQQGYTVARIQGPMS